MKVDHFQIASAYFLICLKSIKPNVSPQQSSIVLVKKWRLFLFFAVILLLLKLTIDEA